MGVKNLVEASAAEVTIEGGAFDGKLARHVLRHGAGERGLAEVEEHNALRLLGVEDALGRLEHAVLERRGGALVQEAEAVELSDLAGVKHRLSLRVGVVT